MLRHHVGQWTAKWSRDSRSRRVRSTVRSSAGDACLCSVCSSVTSRLTPPAALKNHLAGRKCHLTLLLLPDLPSSSRAIPDFVISGLTVVASLQQYMRTCRSFRATREVHLAEIRPRPLHGEVLRGSTVSSKTRERPSHSRCHSRRISPGLGTGRIPSCLKVERSLIGWRRR